MRIEQTVTQLYRDDKSRNLGGILAALPDSHAVCARRRTRAPALC